MRFHRGRWTLVQPLAVATPLSRSHRHHCHVVATVQGKPLKLPQWITAQLATPATSLSSVLVDMETGFADGYEVQTASSPDGPWTARESVDTAPLLPPPPPPPPSSTRLDFDLLSSTTVSCYKMGSMDS